MQHYAKIYTCKISRYKYSKPVHVSCRSQRQRQFIHVQVWLSNLNSGQAGRRREWWNRLRKLRLETSGNCLQQVNVVGYEFGNWEGYKRKKQMSKKRKRAKEKREKFVLQIAETCIRCRRRNSGLMCSYVHLLLQKKNFANIPYESIFFLLEYTQVKINLTLPLQSV